MITRLKHCAGFLRENRIDVKELPFPAKKFVFKNSICPADSSIRRRKFRDFSNNWFEFISLMLINFFNFTCIAI